MWFATLPLFFGLVSAQPNSYTDQLYEDILYFYMKEIRPVERDDMAVRVKFGASLIRLIDLDEKNQILTTNLWLDMEWTDPSLRWDPDKYHGIYKLHIPSSLIWLPDIILYNNAAAMPHVTIMADAMVFYNGTVVWKPPAIYKSFCEIDIRYFPFDEQKCLMKFGGWSHRADALDMIQVPEDQVVTISEKNKQGQETPVQFLMNGMDLTYYYLSAEWDLMNLTSKRHLVEYVGCCGADYYVDITYYFHLRRKPLFFLVNLVIPTMLIALLPTFVFYLPCNKITFSVSILVTLSVFFLVLVDLIPATSVVIALIGRYLLFTLILVAVSVIVTVVTVNLNFRTAETHAMPAWVAYVFLKWLPPYLCMELPEAYEPAEAFEQAVDQKILNSTHVPNFLGSRCLKVPGAKFAHHRRPSPSFLTVEDVRKLQQDTPNVVFTSGTTQYCCQRYIIIRLLENVEFISERFRNLEQEDKETQAWSLVAAVIDRIFLIVFTIVNLTGSCFLILQAPTFWDYTSPLVKPNQTKPLGLDTLSDTFVGSWQNE